MHIHEAGGGCLPEDTRHAPRPGATDFTCTMDEKPAPASCLNTLSIASLTLPGQTSLHITGYVPPCTHRLCARKGAQACNEAREERLKGLHSRSGPGRPSPMRHGFGADSLKSPRLGGIISTMPSPTSRLMPQLTTPGSENRLTVACAHRGCIGLTLESYVCAHPPDSSSGRAHDGPRGATGPILAGHGNSCHESQPGREASSAHAEAHRPMRSQPGCLRQ